MTRRQGVSQEAKKAVRARRAASVMAHDRKIDTLVARATSMPTPPDDAPMVVRTLRRRSGGPIEVLDMSEHTTPSRYAVRCTDHGTVREYPTLAEASRAAKTASEWCSDCAAVPLMKAKVSSRARKRST